MYGVNEENGKGKLTTIRTVQAIWFKKMWAGVA
jgi:hypothetical protein